MARIKTKKQLIGKWNANIKQVKEAYDTVRKSNPDLPGFYYSSGYKDLKRRRRRAEKRWDNRQTTKEQRRIAKEIKKEKRGEGFNEVSDVSLYEAYAGKGRIFEETLIQKHKDGLIFEGRVLFKKKYQYFADYSKFRIETNAIIAKLFDREGDIYAPFIWRVRREYSVKEKTVLMSYEFYRPNNDESEIELPNEPEQ